MTQFDDREKAYESKFAQDREVDFKIDMRRNKLFGLWAAAEMGVEDADAYARTVVEADFERPGDSDVLEKVAADLAARDRARTMDDLRQRLSQCREEARTQIMAEG